MDRLYRIEFRQVGNPNWKLFCDLKAWEELAIGVAKAFQNACADVVSVRVVKLDQQEVYCS